MIQHAADIRRATSGRLQEKTITGIGGARQVDGNALIHAIAITQTQSARTIRADRHHCIVTEAPCGIAGRRGNPVILQAIVAGSQQLAITDTHRGIHARNVVGIRPRPQISQLRVIQVIEQRHPDITLEVEPLAQLGVDFAVHGDSQTAYAVERGIQHLFTITNQSAQFTAG